jgi:benzoyl-CoA reductase subunit C
VTAPIPYNYETELNDVLEHCNQVRMAPVPHADSLPDEFSGTLGHFPVYFPEEIPHAAGLLPVNVLGGGNRLELN